MEQFVTLLELTDIYMFEEIKDAVVCNLNKDKVLVIKKVSTLLEIQEIVYMLPKLKEQIRGRIANDANKAEVENLHLSKFLWDMYVIGLHQINNESEKFNEIEVAKLQRNRFVARKMIIEYSTNDELRTQFNQFVLPERTLNLLLDSYDNHTNTYNAAETEDLLSKIEEIMGR